MQTTRTSCSLLTKIIKSPFICQKSPILCWWLNKLTNTRTHWKQNHNALMQTTRTSCSSRTKTIESLLICQKSLLICQKSPIFCWWLNKHTNTHTHQKLKIHTALIHTTRKLTKTIKSLLICQKSPIFFICQKSPIFCWWWNKHTNARTQLKKKIVPRWCKLQGRP